MHESCHMSHAPKKQVFYSLKFWSVRWENRERGCTCVLRGFRHRRGVKHRLWLRRFRIEPDMFHFYQALRWCCCCWALRSLGLEDAEATLATGGGREATGKKGSRKVGRWTEWSSIINVIGDMRVSRCHMCEMIEVKRKGENLVVEQSSVPLKRVVSPEEIEYRLSKVKHEWSAR